MLEGQRRVIRMKNNHFFSLLCVAAILAVSQTAFADFSVQEDKYSLESYVNAKEPCYERAVIGGPLFMQEPVFPLKEDGRYYARGSINNGIYFLNSFLNKSTNAGDINGQPVRKDFTQNNPGVEMAIGYIWSPRIRGEFEYLVMRNITYAPNPIFANVVVQRALSSEIKNSTLLANIYYDFGAYARFRPFLMFSIGVGVSSTTSTISPVPAGAVVIAGPTQTIAPAGGGGAGFRVHMFTRWFAQVSYRYVFLGTPHIRPTTNIQLDANYSVSLFSLGLIYLF